MCERCGTGRSEGVILQVHHKYYIPGRKPWEYNPEQCEVLCKKCHAIEHGIIQPTTDWTLVGEDDVGGQDGTCEYCGADIRYVFFIEHPKWNSLMVGTDCCDHLTQTSIATDHRKYVERKKRFVSSTRWKPLPRRKGTSISQDGHKLEIRLTDKKFRIVANGTHGKLEFPSELEAKAALFDLLSSGKIQEYFRKKKASSNSQ